MWASMEKRRAEEYRQRIEEDEDRFMVRERIKLVVLGEGDVGVSNRED